MTMGSVLTYLIYLSQAVSYLSPAVATNDGQMIVD